MKEYNHPIKKYKKVLFLVLLQTINTYMYAGDYGDIYGAHPAANGMANAVTATVNNSSSVY